MSDLSGIYCNFNYPICINKNPALTHLHKAVLKKT